RGLAALRPERPIALVSGMEHHANDLPHRLNSQQTLFIPVIEAPNSHYGSLDLKRLEALLEKHQNAINYLAINSTSNVTGITTPISKVCALAHKYDAYVIVDAAQSAAHNGAEIASKSVQQPDFWVFSGHKVYTPAAPGVLIAKKELMNALPLADIGGGAVKSVSTSDYELLENPYREQAGTPNIVGVIALANTLKLLNNIGFSAISKHAKNIAKYALDQLLEIDQISVYGDTHLERTGAISFNIKGIDHGLLAVILSDYFGVAVRNSCFCAHPYVRSLLKRELWNLDLDGIPDDQQENYINRKRGMVRASFSLYTSLEDIDYFIKSLKEIVINYKSLRNNYNVLPDGDYEHKTFKPDWREFYNP
ncbi:MAG: aminotransferase class V-fold PLP-dependent enzyme, partial [Proteobacteria bacterium]|nr:aminotransferase class V-fold PLP-dependent enzyme [Pseudomonadota bacterium]